MSWTLQSSRVLELELRKQSGRGLAIASLLTSVVSLRRLRNSLGKHTLSVSVGASLESMNRVFKTRVENRCHLAIGCAKKKEGEGASELSIGIPLFLLLGLCCSERIPTTLAGTHFCCCDFPTVVDCNLEL